MRSIINRVFSRFDDDSWHSSAFGSTISSEFTDRDIENYLVRIIVDCLGRMLVPPSDVEVTVRRSGVSPAGLNSYSGRVRILKWNPVLTPVLLQNIPVIDANIRKVVQASVILEHTDFSGLWFQASSSTEGSPKALLGVPCELIHQPGGSSHGL